jgi:hypothetical protein
VCELRRTGNSERLKFLLNLHAHLIRAEIRHLRQRRGYNSGQVAFGRTPNDSKLA